MPLFQNDPVVSTSDSTETAAVSGEGSGHEGVRGVSHNTQGGVVGINDFSPASPPGAGGAGGRFESAQGEGVYGWAKSSYHGGVVGENTAGGFGVYGRSDDGQGVVGESNQLAGVFGRGPTGGRFEGGSGPAVDAVSGGGVAGRFEGNVVVTGDIELTGADLAEQFGVVGELAAEPGCVVVLAGDDRVRVSDEPYDRRVAGVVSGAGSYRPAVVLGGQAGADRRPLALTGKVWCKVDADYAPLGLGDMLTTSPTPGHAMNAADPARAFGAVIGKALASLHSGRALVPVLVALQ